MEEEATGCELILLWARWWCLGAEVVGWFVALRALGAYVAWQIPHIGRDPLGDGGC